MQHQQKILDILREPYQLDEQTLPVLKKLVVDYPYCQSLQILLAKNLQNFDKLEFEQQVNKASAYAIDRRKFQRYISDRDKPVGVPPLAVTATEHESAVATLDVAEQPETQQDTIIDQDVPTQVPEEVPEEAPQEVPQEQPEQAPEEAPEEVPEEIPEEAPQKEPEVVPEKTPEIIPSDPPKTVPTRVPTKFPHDVPSPPPAEVPHKMPSEFPGVTPAEVPGKRPPDFKASSGKDIKNQEKTIPATKTKPGKHPSSENAGLLNRLKKHLRFFQAQHKEKEAEKPIIQRVEKEPALKGQAEENKKPSEVAFPATEVITSRASVTENQNLQQQKPVESLQDKTINVKEEKSEPVLVAPTADGITAEKVKPAFSEHERQALKPDINQLIEKFLKEEPRIQVRRDLPETQEDLSARSTYEDPQLVTETLAQVYLKQGNKVKALEIYEKLCLKFPEKSSYFAKKILDIKNEITI